MATERAVLLIVDSGGCGGAPDAADYGDEGSDTLGHVADHVGGLELPTLQAWGLGNLTKMKGVPPSSSPRAAHGRMREASTGKDTTTGHWEICGLVTHDPLTTFPSGFPAELLDAFTKATGRGVLGNRTASGTVIIEDLGREHIDTGKVIVYTSADSVFQVAAHEKVVPVEELHAICAKARKLCDPYRVGRVIARPFVGEAGAFKRTYNRKDFSMLPPAPTLCDHITDAGGKVVGIGKIPDIFADQGVGVNIHTEGNIDGMERTIEALDEHDSGLIFTNLVDFDMLFGHRNNPDGYAQALRDFDRQLGQLENALQPGDLVAITADHGTDPTTPGTDHTREEVPVLVRGGKPADLGTRTSFADLGQTLAEFFRVKSLPNGESFLGQIS